MWLTMCYNLSVVQIVLNVCGRWFLCKAFVVKKNRQAGLWQTGVRYRGAIVMNFEYFAVWGLRL